MPSSVQITEANAVIMLRQHAHIIFIGAPRSAAQRRAEPRYGPPRPADVRRGAALVENMHNNGSQLTAFYGMDGPPRRLALAGTGLPRSWQSAFYDITGRRGGSLALFALGKKSLKCTSCCYVL